MFRFSYVIAGLVAAVALSACARPFSNTIPSQAAFVRARASFGLPADYALLHRFGPDTPSWPDGLARFKKTFYGVLRFGGTHNMGAVFTATDSGRVRIVYNFGTNGGRNDAGGPVGPLVDVGGVLYGLGSSGGTNRSGAIYRITPSGDERVIYSFRVRTHDGLEPWGGLVAIGNTLYGITTQGGMHDRGTIFSVTTTGTERILHRFAGYTDGGGPQWALESLDGVLYGTTGYGGGAHKEFSGCGTIFRVDPSGERYRVLYRFHGRSNGCGPSSKLVAVRGALYGTTYNGGNCKLPSGSCGTIFRITPNGAESVVYRFQGRKDGDGPAGLIAVTDTLYGMTLGGGAAGSKEYCGIGHGCGTLFSIDASGRSERILHAFAGDRDGTGDGSLLNADGRLYGLTLNGGSGETLECGRQEYGPTGCGTIFGMKL